MIFAEPRFATAILEEKDLAGLADANEELDRFGRVGSSSDGPTSSCSSSSARAPPRSSSSTCRVRRCGCPRPSLPRSRCSATRAAASRPPSRKARTPASRRWSRSCPSEAANAPRSLLVVGTLPDVVEDQFQRLFVRARHSGHLLPARRSGELPPVGPRTSYLLAQPFLADTGRRWTNGAPSGSPRRSPSASRAPAAGWRRRRRPSAWPRPGLPPRWRRPRSAPRWRCRSARASGWPASASSSFPTRSSRFRSPASFAANSRWSWSRSARPTCTRTTSPPSSPFCRRTCC